MHSRYKFKSILKPGLSIAANLIFSGACWATPNLASVQQYVASVKIQPRAGEPLDGLSLQQKNSFHLGRKKFAKVFEVSEGLGPVFNDTSCGACHGHPAPSSSIPLGGASIGMTMSTTRFGADVGGVFDPLNSLGGSLLQSRSINFLPVCREVVPVAQATVQSQRLTTPIFGAGLVEAIPDAAIVAGSTNPYVSGRAHLVTALEDPVGARKRAGRFGWKAQVPTVLSFSADASLNEVGITNRLMQFENAPQGNQSALAVCDQVADPEDAPDAAGLEFIDHISNFQRFLAPPPQTPQSGMLGEVLFNQIGCAECHTNTFRTANSPQLPAAIRNKPVKAYSDFLLHDMGLAGDGIGQGSATQREMRTAPLWGLKLRSFFWHDGSQSMYGLAGLDRIVLGENTPWAVFYGHDAPGSEAAFAAQGYSQLSTNQRAEIFNFLKSLGQSEFNLSNFDNVIDRADIAPMLSCLLASGPVSADSSCAVADLDQNGSIDSVDLDGFIRAYQEPQIDCDCDGQNDLLATMLGTVPDTNRDGYPDQCNVQLNLSVGPAYPSFDWQPLVLGQQISVVVSGANAGDSVFLLASLASGAGTSSGQLPSPYAGLCENIPQARNFISMISSGASIQANGNGTAVLNSLIPNSAPFNGLSKIRLQAFSIGANGYRRSSVLTKEID